MMMRMSLHITQSQRQTHELRLTQAQRLAVDTAQLQRRRDLVNAVHGDTFKPKATCPLCHHPLTDLEIMKGFKDDPRDYTTGCPMCNERFLARLHHRSMHDGSIETPFYCPTQTLDQMHNLTDIPLDEFQAFKRIGLVYTHEADLDWKKQVKPFLGKMADTVIAELVGAPLKTVRKLRKEHGIKAYSRREEAEDPS